MLSSDRPSDLPLSNAELFALASMACFWAKKLDDANTRAFSSMLIAARALVKEKNANVSAEASSNHCASSTTHSSGRSSATSESKLNTPNPTRNRSGARPARTPNTISSASRCGSGSLARRSRTGAHEGTSRHFAIRSLPHRAKQITSGQRSRVCSRSQRTMARLL